jgi:predicted metal-dependent hydrolase
MTLSLDRLERSAVILERGRIHYVSGRFFEAHATWEEAWHGETGPMRRLLQGLIMAAGAYQKLAGQRQALGMIILLERALERLGHLPDGFAGLELDRFRGGLERSLVEARAWSAGAPAPAGPAPLGAAVSGGEAASRPPA